MSGVACYAQATSLLERALDIDTRLLGRDHPEVARRLHSLGVCWQSEGELVSARRCYEEALRIFTRQGENQAERAATMGDLAEVLVSLQEYNKAEALLTDALEIDRRVFRNDDHTEVAALLAALARLHAATGRVEQALDLLERARWILQKLRPDSIEVAKILQTLGDLHLTRREPGEARRVWQESLRIKERLLDPHHPSLVMTQVSLDGLQAKERGEPFHLEFLERTVGALRAARNPGRTTVTTAMGALGVEYLRRGRLAEAERTLSEALNIDRIGQPPGRYAIARDLASLALVHNAAGREDDAICCREEAAQILQDISPQSFQLAGVLASLGHGYARRGDLAPAIAAWERAVEIQEALCSQADSSGRDAAISVLATTLVNIAAVYCRQGQNHKATQFASRAGTVLARTREPDKRLAEQVAAILNDCGRGANGEGTT